MKDKFIEWNPSKKSQTLLSHINFILQDYEIQGYVLTLRQLYYQLVSRDVIPNKVEEYSKLSTLVSNARLAGYVDWEMIEDRSRNAVVNAHWRSPQEIVDAAVSQYYISRWSEQEYYVEVWCEKDAVSNIIKPVCGKWDVLFIANRGYTSQSVMYEAYKRLQNKMHDEKHIRILYFGDHDPSGIDMIRDARDRLGLFLYGGGSFEFVDGIALTRNQVDEYDPPNNPAKISDPRAMDYISQHGNHSWELDALEPSVLSRIVEKAIEEYADKDEFDRIEKLEKEQKSKMRDLAKKI